MTAPTDSTTLATGTGQRLYRKARTMIPGATGLFGHRQEMHAPEQWPAYFDKAKGCEVTDLDGNGQLMVKSKTGQNLIYAGANDDGDPLLTVKSKTGQDLINAGASS